jgi:galactoside O-acetyltransferase
MIRDSYFNNEELKNLGLKKIGINVKISRNCSIYSPETIELGNNVRIDDFCILLAKIGYLNIGSNVHIGSFSYLNASGGVNIENFCNLSQGTKIYSKSDNYDGSTITNPTFSEKFTKPIYGKVVLKKHCLLGSGTIILPNVTLNEGVVVGALSLVKNNLKKWSIYAGVPARYIKKRKRISRLTEKRSLSEV